MCFFNSHLIDVPSRGNYWLTATAIAIAGMNRANVNERILSS